MPRVKDMDREEANEREFDGAPHLLLETEMRGSRSQDQTVAQDLTTVEVKKREPKKCAKCRVHNSVVNLKGHDCPHKTCPCPKCTLIKERQGVLAQQIGNRRCLNKGSHPVPPVPTNVPQAELATVAATGALTEPPATSRTRSKPYTGRSAISQARVGVIQEPLSVKTTFQPIAPRPDTSIVEVNFPADAWSPNNWSKQLDSNGQTDVDIEPHSQSFSETQSSQEVPHQVAQKALEELLSLIRVSRQMKQLPPVPGQVFAYALLREVNFDPRVAYHKLVTAEKETQLLYGHVLPYSSQQQGHPSLPSLCPRYPYHWTPSPTFTRACNANVTNTLSVRGQSTYRMASIVPPNVGLTPYLNLIGPVTPFYSNLGSHEVPVIRGPGGGSHHVIDFGNTLIPNNANDEARVKWQLERESIIKPGAESDKASSEPAFI